MDVTVEYLDYDGLTNSARKVPQAEANMLRVCFGDNPGIEIMLDNVPPEVTVAILKTLVARLPLDETVLKE